MAGRTGIFGATCLPPSAIITLLYSSEWQNSPLGQHEACVTWFCSDRTSHGCPFIMPTGATPFPFGDCRVCADKATGVHYGVATCEGCKVSVEWYHSVYHGMQYGLCVLGLFQTEHSKSWTLPVLLWRPVRVESSEQKSLQSLSVSTMCLSGNVHRWWVDSQCLGTVFTGLALGLK